MKMKNDTRVITDPAEQWIYGLSEKAEQIPKKNISACYKEKFNILISDFDFLEKISTIRKTFKIPKDGFGTGNSALEWSKKLYAKSNMEKSFKNAVRKINNPGKISSRWDNVIIYFILFNKLTVAHLIPPPIDIQIETKSGEFRILVNIYKQTTKKDFENSWPAIKRYQKLISPNLSSVDHDEKLLSNKNIAYTIQEGQLVKMSGWQHKRSSIHKNFSQYKKAYTLSKQGKTYKEIATKLGWMESEWPKVGTYIQRFKEMIKENTLL